MDISSSTKPNFHSSEVSRIENSSPKRRKVVQKTVVTVRIEASVGKQKCEGPPSDFWSWRKYGQKPIKGSPYPRGYYRCSTSKGCSAKKQIERCRTDASMLIITYTSTHNHPGPGHQTTPTITTTTTSTTTITTKTNQEEPQNEPIQDLCEIQKQPIISEEPSYENVHLESSINCSENSNQETPSTPKTQEPLKLMFDEPLSYPHIMSISTPKTEENDFFDELEELPISSFTDLVRNSFMDERILVVPSHNI